MGPRPWFWAIIIVGQLCAVVVAVLFLLRTPRKRYTVSIMLGVILAALNGIALYSVIVTRYLTGIGLVGPVGKIVKQWASGWAAQIVVTAAVIMTGIYSATLRGR